MRTSKLGDAMRLRLLAPTLIVLLATAGCATPTEGADVVASFYPVAFLADEIAGDAVTVATIVPHGAAAHDHEPTPRDVARVAQSKLLLVQGLGFESWTGTVTANAATRMVVVSDGVPLRSAGGGHDHDGDGHDDHGAGGDDPHTWLDPVHYQRMARNVEAALVDVFPEHEAAFRANTDDLVARLATLHDEYSAGLAACEVRIIVTTHAAFGYLAYRYDFDQIPISGIDPEAEPDPKAVKNAADEARAHDVRVIFYEDPTSPQVATVVAREANATTRLLSPLENLPTTDGSADYFTVMRENLAALRDAMRCA